MSEYKVSIARTGSKLIGITATFSSKNKSSITLQLPACRPGRYELGHFARNIQRITFYNEKNEPLGFRKTTKDRWEVHCAGSKKVLAVYVYSATELNAGSSFVDANQLYVNPVNCFLYDVNAIDEPCTLQLELPWEKFKVGSSLKKKGNTWHASGFHEMADSPFIASPQLKSFHAAAAVEGAGQDGAGHEAAACPSGSARTAEGAAEGVVPEAVVRGPGRGRTGAAEWARGSREGAREVARDGVLCRTYRH